MCRPEIGTQQMILRQLVHFLGLLSLLLLTALLFYYYEHRDKRLSLVACYLYDC